MQKEYNKIQQAVDRIFDASPLAVNFVQKVSTHGRVAAPSQGISDQQWLPKQASTGLFKVGTRPPRIKATGRPAVSYMDMFGKKANKSSDSSFELVSKSDKNLSSKKQADVPSHTSNGTHVEHKHISDPCILRATTTEDLGRLPARYGLRTRQGTDDGGASVNEAAAKPEKNKENSKPTSKSGTVESSLIKVTEQSKASQDDDDVDSLSNHSEVESERSSDEEEDIKSKPTTNSGPKEASFNKDTEQNDGSQGDDNVDSLPNHSIAESERSSDEEEDIQSNQASESGVGKSSLNPHTEQNEASQDDDVNSLSNQGEVESERSSDEEEVTNHSKTTNLQSETRKVGNLQRETKKTDNGPVVKHQIKRAQLRTEPISKQETETLRNTSYTKSQPAKKDPGQKHTSLTILRLTEPVETPKTIRGSHSRPHRQRGLDSEVERFHLTKSTKGKTLKSTHDSLKRRVRSKEKNLNTSKNKKLLDSLSQKGTEKDPLAFSELPTTRSGRRVKPPLAWWAGQRVFVHPHDDIVEIKPPTPSNERDALSATMIHFKEDLEMERSKRCMSRELLAVHRKSKASLNKSENLRKTPIEGSSHQTCRQVEANAPHQNRDDESGDEGQSSLKFVSTPLSRSMPLYKSNGVISEEDVLEKFDTPGFPKHLRNPPAAGRSRVRHSVARTLEVEHLEADDLCRSFGSTPVSQLMKRRADEDRKRLNTVIELKEETLLRKTHQKKSKSSTTDRSEPTRGRGRPRQNVTKETISNTLTKTHEEKMADQDQKDSKKKTRKQDTSPENSDESDTESVQEGHGRQHSKNEKQSNAASFQSSCSDVSDEEGIEELLRKTHQSKSKPPSAEHSELTRGRGRPRQNVTKETAVQHQRNSKKGMRKQDTSPDENSDESDTESVQEGHGRQHSKNEKHSNAAIFQSSCSDESDEEGIEELHRKTQQSKSKPPIAVRSEPKRGRGRPRKNTNETIYGKQHFNSAKQSNATRFQKSCSDESDEEGIEESHRKIQEGKSKPPTAVRSEPKRGRGRPRKNTKETVYGRQHYTKEKLSNTSRFQSSCSDESDEEGIEELSPKRLTKHQRFNKKPNVASQEENVKKTVNSKTNRKLTSRVTEDESSSGGESEPLKKQRGKVTSTKERRKAESTVLQSVVISDDEGLDSIEEIKLTAQQHNTGRSQTGQEPNDGVGKSTARSTSLRSVESNSKTNRKMTSRDTDDESGSDGEWEPLKRQRGKVTSTNKGKRNDGVKNSKAKSTSLKNAESKPLKKESKSRPGQGKNKVYAAEHQPQLQSKTQTKVFKDKENVIRSSSDSVEDIWSSEEITLYKQSLRTLNPSMDNFWYHVHLLVETKTAQQCQAYHQRCVPPTVPKKKPAPLPKATTGQKPGLTGTTGTLKRKRELKTMIEELNHNHEDDFFDATPARKAKRLKLPTQDDEDDDDFYQNRPNTETPLSTRFTTPNPRLAWMPTSKTPVTSLLSPSLTNTVDRKNTEAYVHRLITKRHKRLPAVSKIVEEQEPVHPETPKAAGGAVYQTLFKKDTPQEVDSEVEEDYYFSDSN